MRQLSHIAAFFLLFFYSALALSYNSAPIRLTRVSINTHDRASLLRGARFFAQSCMACHTMRYLEHNKLATEAGVTLDKMPLENKKWWLNTVPPDLTLITIQRGANWVFTYLHAFYQDPTRPTGYNNLLFKNSNMMNILAGLQGQQALTERGKSLLANPKHKKVPASDLLHLASAGAMTPEQFNQATADLVNFLVYASEPAKLQREKMGGWVLLFLAIFFVLAWFLKKSYWKDIK